MMKRFVHILIAALISTVAAGSVFPASAARSGGLIFANADWFYSKQSPVEQQSPGYLQWQSSGDPSAYSPETWVSNPTPCVWDVDDEQVRYTTGGTLGARAIVTDTLCLNADWSGLNWSGHLAGVSFSSKSSSLRVTISFSPGGSFTAAPVWDARARAYTYRACMRAPSYSEGDPALQPIEGSNGGEAVPTRVTMTVENPTSRGTSLAGQWKIGHYYSALVYC